MSKRFTETDKWRDNWFRKLSPTHKCLWGYLTDNCDHAGVIEVDWELASFQIGAKVRAEDLDAFERQVEILPCGKLLILGFIKFQFGKPSYDCKPHAPIFTALERHGLTYEAISERLSKATPKGIDSLSKGNDSLSGNSSKGIEGISKASERLQEKEKEEDKEQDSAPIPGPGSPITADSVYAAYPRKEARKAAVAAIDRAARACPLGMPYLLERAKLYAAAVARWPAADRAYIPHAATWFNQARYEDDPALWSRDPAAMALPPVGTPVVHRVPDNLRPDYVR